MYQIIFSINNNEEAVVLPAVPPDFGPARAQRNDTYEGLTQDYNVLGPVGLWEFRLDSFFPVGRRYSFMPAESLTDGWQYVAFFSRNRPRMLPFRVVILDAAGVPRLNSPCTVDTFEWRVKRNGDIAYSMTVREYRFLGGSG